MLKFRFIHRAGCLQQIPTVSTLDIQCIPADFIVIKLDKCGENGTAAGTSVGRTNGSKIRRYDWRQFLLTQPK